MLVTENRLRHEQCKLLDDFLIAFQISTELLDAREDSALNVEINFLEIQPIPFDILGDNYVVIIVVRILFRF